MNIFLEIIQNKLLMIPMIAWLIAQVVKLLIHSIVEREFRLSRMFGDGGMPSAHSATVTSLAIAAGWLYGYGSAWFAATTLLAIIVMKDAVGVRRETGKQAHVIKQIADVFNAMFLEKDEAVRTEKLKEFVGHTKTQVFFGALIGGLTSIFAMLILSVPYSSAII